MSTFSSCNPNELISPKGEGQITVRHQSDDFFAKKMQRGGTLLCASSLASRLPIWDFTLGCSWQLERRPIFALGWVLVGGVKLLRKDCCMRYVYHGWLVVWLPSILFSQKKMGCCHHPNWRSPSYFSEGFFPKHQMVTWGIMMIPWNGPVPWPLSL